MNLAATRYLVELRPAPPEPRFLHVFDDETYDWSPAATRALRFATKSDAERFGLDHLTCSFAAVSHPAAELIAAEESEPAADDEADEAGDCGCTPGFVCHQNGNCPRLIED